MTRVFAGDETGNLDLTVGPARGSRYLAVVTLEPEDEGLAEELSALRVARGGSPFHAATDDVATREAVFAVLDRATFQLQATRLDKTRAREYLRRAPEKMIVLAWQLHVRELLLRLSPGGAGRIVVARIGTARLGGQIARAIAREAKAAGASLEVVVARAEDEEILQAADYCAWALQRRWERGEPSRGMDARLEWERSPFDPGE